jgi:hypothetical protein
MTNAAWVKGATMTAALTGTGIDGVANSCSRLTGGAVSATNTAFQTLVAAATSRTYSCFIRRVTGTGVINITQDGGSTYTDITSQINSSTFTKVSLNASVLNAAFGIQIVTSGDVILVDFNQFEAGAFATSPMASAGAARNADVLTYPVAGNISGTVGSVYLETAKSASSAAMIGNIPLLGFGDTGVNGQLLLKQGGSSALFSHDVTGFVALGVSLADTTTTQKIAAAYTPSVVTGAVSGTVGSPVATDGNFNAGASFYIGAVATNPSTLSYYGTIRNVRIYSAQLSASQLQAVTA